MLGFAGSAPTYNAWSRITYTAIKQILWIKRLLYRTHDRYRIAMPGIQKIELAKTDAMLVGAAGDTLPGFGLFGDGGGFRIVPWAGFTSDGVGKTKIVLPVLHDFDCLPDPPTQSGNEPDTSGFPDHASPA